MQIVDTNVFIRHLTRDHAVQSPGAFAFFQRLARGDEEATVPECVIAEVVYILSSKDLYNLAREDIRELLRPIIKLRGLKVDSSDVYLRALDLWAAHRVDFVDAMVVAHAEHREMTAILSYDRDYRRLTTIPRVEP